ncbi:WDR44 family WD repeat protein [Schizosaccharomyces pombe]
MNGNLPHIQIQSPKNSLDHLNNGRQATHNFEHGKPGDREEANGHADAHSSSGRSRYLSSDTNLLRDGSSSLDPLSKHIMKRTRSEKTLSFLNPSRASSNTHLSREGTNRSSNVTRTVSGRKSNHGSSLTDTGESDQLSLKSFGAIRQPSQHRSSLFSRMLGSTSHIFGIREDMDNESLEEERDGIPRVEGNAADPFSWIPDGKNVWDSPPKYIRVLSHNKKEKSLDHLFLAQELYCKPTLAATHDRYYEPRATDFPNLAHESSEPSSSRHTADAQSITNASVHLHNSSSPLNRTPSVISDTLAVAITSNSSSNSSNNAIWAMKFSRDGRYLAVGGQDRILRIWAVLDSEHARSVASETCSSDPNNPKLNLKAPVFSEAPIREYAGHTADILDLSWSRNNFLLSSSMDKTARLWHPVRKDCLCCFEHSDFVTSIAFHPKDDRFFLSGSLDCKLRLWSIKEKAVSFWNELPELITAVAFSPDGGLAIAGTFVGLCLFYDTRGLRFRTQMSIRSSRGKNAKGSKVTGIQTRTQMIDNIAGDTEMLVTTNDSRIRIYNLRDKSLELKFKGHANAQSQNRAYFDDDGNYVICGSEDHQVFIWDLPPQHMHKTKKKKHEHFKASVRPITAAVFAPTKTKQLLTLSGDPVYLAAISARRSSVISNASIETGPSLRNLKSLSHSYLPIEIMKGHIIVCGDLDGRIRVFRQDSAFAARKLIEKKNIERKNSETLSNSSFFPQALKAHMNSISSPKRHFSLRHKKNASQITNNENNGNDDIKKGDEPEEEHVGLRKNSTQEKNANLDPNEALKRADMMMLQEGASSMVYYSLTNLDNPGATVNEAAKTAATIEQNEHEIQTSVDPISNVKAILPNADDVSSKNSSTEDQLECPRCGNSLFNVFSRSFVFEGAKFSIVCSHCNRKLLKSGSDDGSETHEMSTLP